MAHGQESQGPRLQAVVSRVQTANEEPPNRHGRLWPLSDRHTAELEARVEFLGVQFQRIPTGSPQKHTLRTKGFEEHSRACKSYQGPLGAMKVLLEGVF